MGHYLLVGLANFCPPASLTPVRRVYYATDCSSPREYRTGASQQQQLAAIDRVAAREYPPGST